MPVSLSEIAAAINAMNDRLLKVEAQNLVLSGSLRKVLRMQFEMSDVFETAWAEGLKADLKTWEKQLTSAKDEPTEKFISAGIDALKVLQSFDDVEDHSLTIINGGKPG
ncbi:hypothetical protein ASD74_06400 [Rhizobium sp. Root564]|nr:hypothetical protein ASD74_06400 [Rhizobium sp. Root564]